MFLYCRFLEINPAPAVFHWKYTNQSLSLLLELGTHRPLSSHLPSPNRSSSAYSEPPFSRRPRRTRSASSPAAFRVFRPRLAAIMAATSLACSAIVLARVISSRTASVRRRRRHSFSNRLAVRLNRSNGSVMSPSSPSSLPADFR